MVLKGKAIAPLRKFLMTPTRRWSDPRVVFWYTLSIVVAVYYGYLVLQSAFSAPFVVQDDARQHVFWMLRSVNPALFPQDFMADYFAAQAPAGYHWLYRTAAEWGINPLVFNKILPPILGLLGTHYCFQFSLQLLPLPGAAFTSTLLLNQSLWMRDDLVSGTPRAFVYVLLLAFLVYVHRRAIAPCLVVLALQPLFYPQVALLSAAILVIRLFQFKSGKVEFSQAPRDYWLSGLGLGILALLLAPYAFENSAFGSVVTPAEARQMPEFLPGGRASYFTDNPILFWFGDRSGFIPTPVLTPPMLAFSLVFPWLWWRAQQNPLMQTIRANAAILQQLVLASFGLYLAAHLTLFTLHLPSRYTFHSLRIVFALAASFVLWIIFEKLLHVLEKAEISFQAIAQKGAALVAVGLIVFGLASYSELTQSFPFTNNRFGTMPKLYRFLRSTPTDTTIASLTKETSNLHTFAQRSPLIAPELGLPYHQGYYSEFRQRTVALIRAQYGQDLSEVQAFIEQYDVDYWLLDEQVFAPNHLRENRWLQQYQPEARAAIAALENGATPLLLAIAESQCTVLQTTAQENRRSEPTSQQYWLLDANCIAELSQTP